MFKCLNCGTPYNLDDKFCAKCGRRLTDPRTSTIALQINPNMLRLHRATDESEPEIEVQNVERTLLLQVRGMTERLVFEEGTEVVLGRNTIPDSDVNHFDLTRYGAHNRGVSRAHAAIRFSEGVFALIDMDSANGTFANGVRLAPHEPHILRDGEEIMLGALSMTIKFE